MCICQSVSTYRVMVLWAPFCFLCVHVCESMNKKASLCLLLCVCVCCILECPMYYYMYSWISAHVCVCPLQILVRTWELPFLNTLGKHHTRVSFISFLLATLSVFLPQWLLDTWKGSQFVTPVKIEEAGTTESVFDLVWLSYLKGTFW